ncbi:MAG: hypothetical protein LBV74_07045 [Tannerella sp.]|jgi:hypothetical protein|nr:hypothetical protein [Tannerella sp.]
MDYLGGLIGYNAEQLSITNCNANVHIVSGDSFVGGLIGCSNKQLAMNNCYAHLDLAGGNPNLKGYNIGGLIGYCAYSSIKDCYANSSQVNGSDYIGGLIGYNAKQLSISNCSAKVEITSGHSFVGGLIGCCNDQLAMNNCHANTDQISGNTNKSGNKVGGLIGYSKGVITKSSSTYGLISAGNYTGGLLGEVAGGLITQCYANSTVAGKSNTGGLVGGLSGTLNTISNCYVMGRVSGRFGTGGLIGHAATNGTISKSYSACNVTSSGNAIGAFVGYRDISIANCYYLKSGFYQQNEIGNTGMTSLTEDEMKSENNFVGFDFSEIWDIHEGECYPFLREIENNIPDSPTKNETLTNGKKPFYSFMTGNLLHIKGLSLGKPFAIYNLQGQAIYSGFISSEIQNITLPAKGIYIITSEEYSIKVVYR